MIIVSLDKYISELLFQHDCIVIPEFGGFVANYAAAKIHPTQHVLTPPSKKIAFNKKLQNNDGVLASHIAKVEKVSYAEANKWIQDQVETFNILLKEAKQIKINNVGTLFFDIEKNLQFEADNNMNYLLDSFGLISLQSPAIKRENIQERIEKQFQDRPAIESPAKMKRFPWKVLIPVPVIGLVIWGAFQFTSMDSLNINYNSFNPFASKNEITTITPVKPTVVREASVPVVTEPVSNEIVPTETSEPVIQKQEAVVISEPVKEQVQAASESTEYSFYIVAGCFKEESNANNMLKMLQSKGYNALIKGKNPAGLTVVCYAGFSTRQEAAVELAKIQSEQDKNAWLSSN